MMRRAVVIGAGVGGMLAAAAMSVIFDEVIVLDRDNLPIEGPDHRKGLPQGRHAHLLMAGGLDAMEYLVPVDSFKRELLDAGAREIPLSSGMVTLSPEGWLQRWNRRSHHTMLTCSRALLDWTLRTSVMRHSSDIEIRKASVAGLTGDAGRVTGVRTEVSGQLEDLPADLVIDASGRGSRIINWLAGLGISGIVEKTVDSGLVNATRIYRTPPGAENFPLTLVQANPYTGRPGRSAVIVPIEGDRWMVSLAGTRGGEPPADAEDFVQYTRDLPHPIVSQLIAGAEPLTDVFVSHSTSNARRYLEKASQWPDGLVVLGDALATFNPAYGQGMSVAALGALELRHQLKYGDPTAPGRARTAQRAIASYVDTAWSVAVSQDALYIETRGAQQTAADRLAAGYTRRLTRAATSSLAAATALWEVSGLRKGPARLLHPRTVLAVLLAPSVAPLSAPPLNDAERGILAALAALEGPSSSTPAA
ncbi:FAD-dependent monooxygenase [Streptomyces sp. NPDC004579]|uniref:FAD-dependent oxidoreductase n=1 Tax=Streptomyces sp. NPDC004579 TaxID=3154667 RepID=UPI0033A07207